MARREARSIITVVHGVDARARRRLRPALGAGRRGEALHAHVRESGPGRVSSGAHVLQPHRPAVVYGPDGSLRGVRRRAADGRVHDGLSLCG